MKHQKILPIFLGIFVFSCMSASWGQSENLEQNRDASQDHHLGHSKAAVSSRKLPKDQLSELGSEDQLKLQQEMDRQNKIKQGMSNMMKKESDTSSSLIGNLK
ncbi:MAG: hypothetical protein KGO49_07915 [Gammaproteobacteria bacterium]|nr:hypothetical protein [Gammaproteobacteria bacterium]